jgi:tetratricopeptide (TPR) repeat protein
MRRLVALVLLTAVTGCGPKVIPAPTVDVPKYPDFLPPTVPASLSGGVAALNQDRGWHFLQAGDLRNAEREFSAALHSSPEFYPAEISLGYLELARKDPRAALERFERAIPLAPDDASPQVGRGQALLELNREADAVGAFEAAIAIDPGLADVKRRVDVLRFRGVEQDIARARQATRSGRLDDAVADYTRAIASSPDSAFLYRELGAVERQKGDQARALEHFRRAVTLDPTDAKSFVQIGEILEARGEFDAAEKSYADALAVEPGEAVQEKIDAVRTRAELARMPEQYRAIEHAAQITRGDLAALIAVRLAPLLQAGRSDSRIDASLVTDVRENWAASWILTVARAGVMEPLPNHTFQPRAIVRRVDFAQVANRLLARIAALDPARGRAWETPRVKFTDLAPGHLAYPAAAACVAAGVIKLESDGSFEPSRPVTGDEAIAAIARIAKLAGPLAADNQKRAR